MPEGDECPELQRLRERNRLRAPSADAPIRSVRFDTSSSMPIAMVPQCSLVWTGLARLAHRFGEAFILTKNGREACCALRSHQFGWELLLFVGRQLEVVQSQVCQSQDEVLTTGESGRRQ